MGIIVVLLYFTKRRRIFYHEVPSFDSKNGILSRSIAHKDRCRWHVIEQEANKHRLDGEVYSIAVVTKGMLEYYTSRGPVHLQNWTHALNRCHILGEG